jgi:hypothetical protein
MTFDWPVEGVRRNRVRRLTPDSKTVRLVPMRDRVS